MTIFSRIGILGLMIWAGILGVGMITPAWTIVRGGKLSAADATQYPFWTAALAATWVNSSFRALLEGHVLQISFWLMLGLGAGQATARRRLAAVRAGAHSFTIRQPARVS